MRCASFAVALISCVVAGSASAQSYAIVDLAIPPNVDEGTPRAINDAGAIVGDVGNSTSRNATLWSAQDPQRYTGVGNARSIATAINDNGEAVGGSGTATDNGEIFDLINPANDRLLAPYTTPTAVNDNGIIVGMVPFLVGPADVASLASIIDDTGGTNHVNLGSLPGVQSSGATAINNSEEIVGFAGEGTSVSLPITSLPVTAVLFDNSGNGHNINLGTLGGPYSYAAGISSAGQVIGFADTTDDYPHATLFDSTGAGHNIDLGTLGGNSSNATSISRNGLIVGMADDQFGFSQPTIFDPSGGHANINLALHVPASHGCIQQLSGVNINGQIIGTASTKDGPNEPMLMIPKSTPGPVGITFSYNATAQANTNSISAADEPVGANFQEQWQETETGNTFNDDLNEKTEAIVYNHDASSLDILSRMAVEESFINGFRPHYLETSVDALINIGTSPSVSAGTPLKAEISALAAFIVNDKVLGNTSCTILVKRDGIAIADINSTKLNDNFAPYYNKAADFTVYAGEQLELQADIIENSANYDFTSFFGTTFTIVPEPAVGTLAFSLLAIIFCTAFSRRNRGIPASLV